MSAQVGDFVGGGDGFTGTLVRGGVSAIANAATRTALDNRTQFGDNLRAVIPDVIGQALWAGFTAPPKPAAQVEADPGDEAASGQAGFQGFEFIDHADGTSTTITTLQRGGQNTHEPTSGSLCGTIC